MHHTCMYQDHVCIMHHTYMHHGHVYQDQEYMHQTYIHHPTPRIALFVRPFVRSSVRPLPKNIAS